MSARRDAQELQKSITPGTVIVATAGTGLYEQFLLDGRHSLRADEPVAVGGGDAGPSPYELLLMALGGCTSMTVSMYANRKKWPVDQVIVRLRHERVYADDCVNCEDPKSKIDRIWLAPRVHRRIGRDPARAARRDLQAVPGPPHAVEQVRHPHRASSGLTGRLISLFAAHPRIGSVRTE